MELEKIASNHMQKIRVLFKDEYLVVVEKPAGYQVHTPEAMSKEGKTLLKNNLVRTVRDQLGQWVYPVHRLDQATSGILVLSLSSENARELHKQFQAKTVEKKYIALVRGWTDDQGEIGSPLSTRLDGGRLVEAKTVYQTLRRFEVPVTMGPHASARYSLVWVSPITGKLHQIRRHFKRISHPLVGDTVHGDGKHNRLWRSLVSSPLLYLKSYQLEFVHPVTHQKMIFTSRWTRAWHEMFDLAGVCPYAKKPANEAIAGS